MFFPHTPLRRHIMASWSARPLTALLALAFLLFGFAGPGNAQTTDQLGPSAQAAEAPRAEFVMLCDGFTCTMDASASVDPDGGTIESFRWDVEDGSHGEGVVWGHTFSAPGVYTVRLTVTDNDGAEGVLERTIEFAGPDGSSPPPPTTDGPVIVPPTGVETGGGTLIPGPSRSPTDSPEPTATEYPNSEAPSTPGSGNAGSPGQEAQQVLDECFEGKLVFRPPSPMVQGETEQFAVRVAFRDSPVDPAEELPGEGPVESRFPRLCELMRAELTGDGMDIKLTSGGDDLIELPSEGVGRWTWDITPLEAGTKQMVLTIYTLGKSGGKIEAATLQETIEVKVGIGYVLGTTVKEWADPLGITIPVLVGAVGAAYLWWRRKHYKPKHAASTPASGGAEEDSVPKLRRRFGRRRAV
ncbi:hypothetical protein D477_009890 [Arthrobacter crystallopoietes BAB-32]|uniref:PKD domain-containing protein n=1 Tax=Arthrobacter crystallopoietes BAB-32 TaxID=1246476 RepID=N1UVH3_9MICC|nr:PKD domain-containing protein [Arthrobacter crystallopoietes]EMY34401.1 hypothetical protein D477_009890 [Arthrobacter crystallopoietes BAB-32]